MNTYNAPPPAPYGRPDDALKSATAGNLRRMLREKFPGAQIRYEMANPRITGAETAADGEDSRVRETGTVIPLPPQKISAIATAGPPDGTDGARFLKTGVAALDSTGLEKGAITEVVGNPDSACGTGLILAGIILRATREGRFVALVDARDSFDPHASGTGGCRSLLWVRCGTVGQALQTADLLLRDGNLPLVILDLQMSCHRQLDRVPGSTWFRLRSLAEHTATPLLAFTPHPLISCAHLRLGLPERAFSLASVEWPREDLEAALRPMILRRRHNPGHMESTRIAV